MNKFKIKTYSKFDIDLNKVELEYDDVLVILKSTSKNINFDNDKFVRELIDGFPKDFPSAQKFHKYLKGIVKGRVPNQKLYWTSRGYTEEEAITKVKEAAASRINPMSKLYWTSRGYTEEEAKNRISSEVTRRNNLAYSRRDEAYRRKKSPLCVEYWTSRGYTEEEATSRISARNSIFGLMCKGKMPIDSRNTRIEYYLSRGYSIKEASDKLSKRQATKGKWKNYDKFVEYSNLVRAISDEWVNKGYVKNSEIRGTEYHLDHVFSIAHGYLQNIPVNIIGHYTNLEIVKADYNFKKSWKCGKSKSKLIEDYYGKGNGRRDSGIEEFVEEL